MNRRNFLHLGSIVSISLAFSKAGRLFSGVTTLDRWRTFQLTTRIEVLKSSGATRVWVPAALISEISDAKVDHPHLLQIAKVIGRFREGADPRRPRLRLPGRFVIVRWR